MKNITLLLISLFLFSINLNSNKTTKKLQSDTITMVASSIDCSSPINVQDVKMLSDISICSSQFNNYNTVLSTSSIVTSNHFVTNLSSNDLYISNYTNRVNNNLNKVQRLYTAKTLGLQYDNSKYFNIYLYQCVNKLGFT